MDLSIDTKEKGTTTCLVVTGEVDVSNAAELRTALDAALESGAKSIEVDMASVGYIDSTGIGVLVGAAHRAAEQGGELVIAKPQPNVSRVLGLLGVAAELNVRES
ncbi:MAG: STAS domain-containing protein [Atopobiaceae bacterium]|jgi:anti-sigma B factor antagonist|nr:STAS domain-containing protein [Atopobiaceae bacterium]MCI2174166.1 STAS domain-containing protein [Atopobiaceae bacterium]MCI2206807.1 STAS domain-containing protein [Atopobiaceae bacterium]